MRNRIIINIRDDTPDEYAVRCVAAVIKEGRQSSNGTSYCHMSQFTDNTMVSAERTHKSDIFNVWKGRDLK